MELPLDVRQRERELGKVTRDDRYVVIGANADSIFKRMMNAIGRPDLATDPRLRTTTAASRAPGKSKR